MQIRKKTAKRPPQNSIEAASCGAIIFCSCEFLTKFCLLSALYIRICQNLLIAAHPYVSKLSVQGRKYAVKSVIAEDRNENRYYDHKLTAIKKDDLLPSVRPVTSEGSGSKSPFSVNYDKQLFDLLQDFQSAEAINSPSNRDFSVSPRREAEFVQSAREERERVTQQLKDAGADDETANAGGEVWANHLLARARALGMDEHGRLRPDALTPADLDKLNVRGEEDAEADWGGNVYDQAVRAGLDMDERVPVVTLESKTDKKLTPQRLLAKLAGQLDKSLGITADGEADVHVRSRGRRRLPRHIVYSSLKRLSPKKRAARIQVVNSIGDLIPHAWLVESSATNKTGKDNVAAYHRFYVPVRIGNTFHVVRVVAEESKTSKGLKPMDVDLYDVIIENSGSAMPRLTSPKRSTRSDSSASEGSISEEITSQKSAKEITIREMLRGVKGMDGEYYAQNVVLQMK